MASSHNTTADFLGRRSWRQQHGGETFPTEGSLEWFIRNHRTELIESGELIPRAGRAGDLLGPNFGRVAVEILRRKAQEVA